MAGTRETGARNRHLNRLTNAIPHAVSIKRISLIRRLVILFSGGYPSQVMFVHRRILPSPLLRGVIRGFSERRIPYVGAAPTTDLPARPDQFIEFYFATPYAVSQSGAAPSDAPRTALVAPHTRPGKRLMLTGEADNFTIHFMPSGLHRLFGLELSGLADQAVHAADLLKAAITDLRDRLERTPRFEDRVAAAEAFLGAMLSEARPEDGVDAAMRDLLRAGGNVSVSAMARKADLSERQFNRLFIRRSSLTPRLYGRLVRFHSLLSAQTHGAHARLTDLAHEAGYYDQAHFIRDCRAFTGKAPCAYLTKAADGDADDRFIQFSNRPFA